MDGRYKGLWQMKSKTVWHSWRKKRLLMFRLVTLRFACDLGSGGEAGGRLEGGCNPPRHDLLHFGKPALARRAFGSVLDPIMIYLIGGAGHEFCRRVTEAVLYGKQVTQLFAPL
jgi:hypothetical protein